MSNDEILNSLNDRIGEILKRLQTPIVKYRKTQADLLCCDVSKDDVYRSNFALFYRFSRRKAEWQNHYFTLLEAQKHNSDIRFDYVLRELQARTGRVEPSFSSKLVATINPHRPVIDSVVLGVLNYKQPYGYRTDRIERLVNLYDQLTSHLEALTMDARFHTLRNQFMVYNPHCEFTDMKILDLLLWQLR